MHSEEKEAKNAQLFEKSEDRSHACSVCGRFFTTNSNMNRHIRDMHSANKERFHCRKCPKDYASKGNLKLHVKKDHCKQKIVEKTGKSLF